MSFSRLATWEVIRYLLNIELSQSGDSLICAVQIFSRPDWLRKWRGGEGGGMDQLGQIAVGKEIKKNTITHTHMHKQTHTVSSLRWTGAVMVCHRCSTQFVSCQSSCPPWLGWGYSPQHNLSTQIHTHYLRSFPILIGYFSSWQSCLMTTQVCTTVKWFTATDRLLRVL